MSRGRGVTEAPASARFLERALRYVEVVLCDADGNLFPSEEPAFDASAVVTNELLASLGISSQFSGEQLRRATTGKNFRTTALDLVRSFGANLNESQLERWVEEEKVRVTAHLARQLQPVESVIAALSQLRESFRLAAVSSSAQERLAACFQASGQDQFFPRHLRFSAEDSLRSPRSKPHPGIYRFAYQSLGVEPEACIAIEDSVPGVQSAVAAGIGVIGNVQFVPPHETSERISALARHGAFTVVRSWPELPQLLNVARATSVECRRADQL